MFFLVRGAPWRVLLQHAIMLRQLFFIRPVWYRVFSLHYASIRRPGIILTGYLCAKFRFAAAIAELAYGEKSSIHSHNNSSRLFDAPGTEAWASEYVWNCCSYYWCGECAVRGAARCTAHKILVISAVAFLHFIYLKCTINMQQNARRGIIGLIACLDRVGLGSCTVDPFPGQMAQKTLLLVSLNLVVRKLTFCNCCLRYGPGGDMMSEHPSAEV